MGPDRSVGLLSGLRCASRPVLYPPYTGGAGLAGVPHPPRAAACRSGPRGADRGAPVRHDQGGHRGGGSCLVSPGWLRSGFPVAPPETSHGLSLPGPLSQGCTLGRSRPKLPLDLSLLDCPRRGRWTRARAGRSRSGSPARWSAARGMGLLVTRSTGRTRPLRRAPATSLSGGAVRTQGCCPTSPPGTVLLSEGSFRQQPTSRQAQGADLRATPRAMPGVRPPQGRPADNHRSPSGGSET